MQAFMMISTLKFYENQIVKINIYAPQLLTKAVLALNLWAPMWILGIDIGGSKIEVILSQGDRVVSTHRAEGINRQIAGEEMLAARLSEVVNHVLHNHGLVKADILVAGGAGLGRAREQHSLEHILKSHGLADLIIVRSDAEIALWGALSGLPGAVTIAGTGSIVYGRNEKGKVYRAGGYGYVIGDDGSGFWIGRAGLRAAIAAAEGWGESTVLKELALKRFNARQMEDIIPKIYEGSPQKNVADFALTVMQTAENGDTVARGIVLDAAKRLATVSVSLLNKLRLKGPKRLRLSGSVFRNKTYRQHFEEIVKKECPGIDIDVAEHSPSYGAVLLGLSHASNKKISEV